MFCNTASPSRRAPRLLGFLMICLGLVLGSVLASNPAYAQGSANPVRLTFPVTLGDGQTYRMVGYYYAPASSAAAVPAQTLQVVLHGATYNHRYWDAAGMNGSEYSYAGYMTGLAGRNYAVIALDLLGVGESDKPDGDFLTVNEMASAVHQVLMSLRYVSRRIVLVGHSMGTVTATLVQGKYHDADALVCTGMDQVGPLPFSGPALDAILSLAAQGPYFGFPPEVRAQLFFWEQDTDPAMLQYDATTLADVVSRGFFMSVISVMYNQATNGAATATGPVLVQFGEHDVISPASRASDEAAKWGPGASVTVQSITNVGHSYNLELSRRLSWDGIDDWIQAVLR